MAERHSAAIPTPIEGRLKAASRANVPRTSGADRRRLILEVAGLLFAERGFPNVSTNDIGANAGITGPAVYRHFRSKDLILEALFEDILDNLLKSNGTLERKAPSKDAAHFVRSHVSFALADRARLKLWDQQARYLEDGARMRMRTAQRAYVESFASAVRSTFGTSKPDAVQVVLGVIALIHAIAQRATGKDHVNAEYISRVAVGALQASSRG